MGFLNNMFGKKDDVFAKAIKDRKKLEKSVNYQFTSGMFKAVVTDEKFNFDQFYNNEKEAQKLVDLCLDCVYKAKKLKIPTIFKQMPILFQEKNNIKAMVLLVPDVKMECECNYVAVVKNSQGQVYYYTNEYYEKDNNFGLCLVKNQMRFSLSDRPITLEDFTTAIFKGEN